MFRYVVTIQGMENYDCEDRLPYGTPRSWKFKGGSQIVLGESSEEFTQHEIAEMHRTFFVQWGTGQYKESYPSNQFVYVPCGFCTLKPGELTDQEEIEEWKSKGQEW